MARKLRTVQSDPELEAMRHRFQGGDVDAFRVLASPHVDDVFTLCLRMCGSRAQAEDAAQTALERAMRRHRQYQPSRPLRPWLLAIAANECRSRLRSPWWRRWNPLSGSQPEPTTPVERLEGADADARVRHALSTLAPTYREAVSLFFLDDLSYDEMAAITGVSVAALKQRVRRGRAMLAERVEKMYPDLAGSRSKGEGEE